jgi:hypothetical protein
MNNLRDDIVEGVASVQKELTLKALDIGGRGQENELLLFLKPECFLHSNRDQQADLIDVALQQLRRFGLAVAGCVVMAGQQLREQSIMDRHYGYINRLSRGASVMLSEAEMADLRKSVDVVPDVPVIGGHEFLARYPEYDEAALDALWSSKTTKKLKSGFYYQSYQVDGRMMVLVNGFHPAQVSHFTADDRKIVLLLLKSDLPWKILRGVMLGDTFPERAVPGSFRRTLFDQPSRFGLPPVSIANNGCHLSAGPFEAMFELVNFFSQSDVAKFHVDGTRMWELMTDAGVASAKRLDALNNPVISIGGFDRTLFDFTEESDGASSAHFYARWCSGKTEL